MKRSGVVIKVSKIVAVFAKEYAYPAGSRELVGRRYLVEGVLKP